MTKGVSMVVLPLEGMAGPGVSNIVRREASRGFVPVAPGAGRPIR
jgi:hypothetical protein